MGQRSSPRRRTGAAANSPLRVLIADPEEHLLALYREGLAQLGFEVVTAVDALQCLEALRQAPPDILVLDPNLPWGGGDGVLEVMHEDFGMAGVPVMILTFGCDPAILYNIGVYPIRDFQRKPMTGRRLAERIAALVAGPQGIAPG